MLISMTGFGRSEVVKHDRQVNIEVKTVNHRYMDISIKMPRSFTFLEDKIRQVIKDYIKRGRVEIYISYKNIGDSDINITPDVSLAEQYLQAFGEIHEKFGITNDVTVSTIARFPDVLQIEKKEEDQEVIWSLLQEGIEAALNNLLEMRKTEGNKLKEDLIERLNTLILLVKKIEERSPEIVLGYKERLTKRVKELLEDELSLDEGRIALEVALFADRSNITEEIVRFHSHIHQFTKSMEENEAVGRKLDFIIQEMNREINTIGSKANDLTISNTVVEIKSELEKIREQVQNIE